MWHFCGARNTDKIEVLNKRILRFILGDFESAYYNLLGKVNCASLYNKRIHYTLNVWSRGKQLVLFSRES